MKRFILYDVYRDDLPLFEEDYGIIDIVCYGGSPREINGNRYNLTRELEEWLNSEIISQYEYDIPSAVLEFQHEEDAMLFKLTWL